MPCHSTKTDTQPTCTPYPNPYANPHLTPPHPPHSQPRLQVFMRARKYPGLGWQAYVASAQMEWQHDRTKDTIPRNILELGLKAFLGVPEYVEHYVQFLLGGWGVVGQ